MSVNAGAYAVVDTGSGTANTMTKWSTTKGVIANSGITDNGTLIDTGENVQFNNQFELASGPFLVDGGALSYMQMGDASTAAVSATGSGNLIYDNTNHTFDVSTNAGAYVSLLSGPLGATGITGTVASNNIPRGAGTTSLQTGSFTDTGTAISASSTLTMTGVLSANDSLALASGTAANNFAAFANGSGASVSASSTGRLIYDNTNHSFDVSENAGAYVSLLTGPLGASGVTGTGTANTMTKWTGTNTIGNGSSTDNGTTTTLGSSNFSITNSTGATTILNTVGITTPSYALAAAGSPAPLAINGSQVGAVVAASTTVNDLTIIDNSTYTTTGGAVVLQGISIELDGTRTTGAAGIQQSGLAINVTGGAGTGPIADAINVAAGNMDWAGTGYWAVGSGVAVSMSGAVTIGNSSLQTGSLASVNGASFTSTANGTEPLSVGDGPTAQTTSGSAATILETGTYNTTSGALSAIALTATNTATRSSGANALTNVGGLFAASGAQTNIALETGSGSVSFANNLAVGGGISLTPAGVNDYLSMANGSGAGVSSANTGALIYDSTHQTFDVSLNGGAYTALTTGGITGTVASNNIPKGSGTTALQVSLLADSGSTLSYNTTSLTVTTAGLMSTSAVTPPRARSSRRAPATCNHRPASIRTAEAPTVGSCPRRQAARSAVTTGPPGPPLAISTQTGQAKALPRFAISRSTTAKARRRSNAIAYFTGSTKNVEFKGTTQVDGNASFQAHVKNTGGTALTTTSLSCGASPAITGMDLAGIITVGAATTTSCTLTFSATYTTAPYCVCSSDAVASGGVFTGCSTTATTLVATLVAGSTAQKFTYICIGP